jgi:hypothetical protein
MKTGVLAMALSDLVLRVSAYISLADPELRYHYFLTQGVCTKILPGHTILNPIPGLEASAEVSPSVCPELAQKGVEGICITLYSPHPPHFERDVAVALYFERPRSRQVYMEFREQEDGTIQIKIGDGFKGAITEDEATNAQACLREAFMNASQCTWTLVIGCRAVASAAENRLNAHGVKHRQRMRHIMNSIGSKGFSYLTTPVDIWMDEHLIHASQRVR